MPNWVKNKIIIGNSKYGKELIDKYVVYNDETGEVEFDFNKVIKMPEELKIEYSTTSDKALCLYLTYINPSISYYGKKEDKISEKDYADLICLLKEKAITVSRFDLSLEKISELIEDSSEIDLLKLGKQQVENAQKYGSINWYDWSINNWGTKWNADNYVSLDDDKVLMFETAWDPAVPVIIEISKQNPKMRFAFLYSDEEIGAHVGYFLIQNGCIDFEGTFEDYSVDAYKLAFDLWGCADLYEHDEKERTYVYNG